MEKKRRRFFNTTGPCNPEEHYMLPPAERLVGAQLHRYIGDRLYWVLHAPRQTGKTTFLQSWMREINAGDEAVACYVSLEDCQGITGRDEAMRTIYNAIRDFAKLFRMPIPQVDEKEGEKVLRTTLMKWAELAAPKPLVVLFDEADVLQGDPLISFLRQLRGGFAGRGIGAFPVSIALVGMRDLKDYITAAKGGLPVNPGSPFNVKSDSATLSYFTKEEISHLFAQRTDETGQRISPEALDYVFDQSRGQPWIVNSLFMRATMRALDADSNETVTIDHIQEAREQIINARETHLDALAYRLDDPAIRGVIEAIMAGESDPLMAQGEAFRLCLDLGLVAIENGSPGIANPIYREVIARQLSFSAQMAIPAPEWKWEKPDGTLDMDSLLKEFQNFWRNNSDVWEKKMNYPEAFPHLLLMAFLQRVTNGSGRIEREYAAGRGRMDLAVEYGHSWNIIEVKLLRPGRSFNAVMEEGVAQTLGYLDRFSKVPGGLRKDDKKPRCYLVIFDRRSRKPSWENRLKWLVKGDVTVAGC